MDSKVKISHRTENLISQIGDRARNLYETRQMLCTEAVVVALNKGLGGGLTQSQSMAIAAPFCAAMGESGCLCGALSGAVIISGVFLAKDVSTRNRKDLRLCARQLHEAFKLSNGSTCCRVLSKKVKHDKNSHFRQCMRLTAEAAEMAARLILKRRPELAEKADHKYLFKKQSSIGGILSRMAAFLKEG